jgi:hypothetical protein
MTLLIRSMAARRRSEEKWKIKSDTRAQKSLFSMEHICSTCPIDGESMNQLNFYHFDVQFFPFASQKLSSTNDDNVFISTFAKPLNVEERNVDGLDIAHSSLQNRRRDLTMNLIKRSTDAM